MRIDEDIVSAIKRFVESPSYYDQGKVSDFLDACRGLVNLSREHCFGVRDRQEISPEDVLTYYQSILVPALSRQLSLSLLPMQLNNAAAHIASLSSVISEKYVSGELSSDLYEKINGLIQLLTVFLVEVCQKIDDRPMYYKFVDDYREPFQRYLNVLPGEKYFIQNTLASGVGLFSPKEGKNNADSEAEERDQADLKRK